MLTIAQRNTVIIASIVFGIVVVLMFVQLFSWAVGASLLGSSNSVTDLDEYLVGGNLNISGLEAGNHTLEFSAKTDEGVIVSDSVTFNLVAPDPYGLPDPTTPPDPYAPEETSTPNPY